MHIIKKLVRGFINFHLGVLKMPVLWQLWLVLLVSANMVVPLLFLDRLEAQVVLATLGGAFILMVALTGFSGFTRLLGLGHLVFWTPAVVFLVPRLNEIPADDFFGIWLRVLLILNILSLVIDAADVIRYAAGDREETVTGLKANTTVCQCQ